MKDKPAHSEHAVADWPERLTVTSPAAAAYLTDMQEAIFLKPFHTVDGTTIGEVARQLALSPNAVYRRVKTLEALGILEVIRQDARRGKPVRSYRARARVFFIPDHIQPIAEWVRFGLQEQMEVFNDNLVRAVQEGPQPVRGLVSGDLGGHLRIAFAQENGEVWNPRAPGVAVTKWAFKTVRLDYARAQQLVAELRGVMHRYYDDAGPDLYLLGQFLAPVVSNEDRDEASALRIE